MGCCGMAARAISVKSLGLGINLGVEMSAARRNRPAQLQEHEEWGEDEPQRLKPAAFCGAYGTIEVVP